MKTRLLLIVLLCSSVATFAEKKSTYLITRIPIVMSEVNAPKASKAPKAATVTTANTAEPKVQAETISKSAIEAETIKATPALQAEDAQLKKDMAYIAYLWKAGLFDFRKRQELSASYDLDAINALFNQYTKDELEAMSKGHSKSLRKYSLD